MRNDSIGYYESIDFKLAYAGKSKDADEVVEEVKEKNITPNRSISIYLDCANNILFRHYKEITNFAIFSVNPIDRSGRTKKKSAKSRCEWYQFLEKREINERTMKKKNCADNKEFARSSSRIGPISAVETIEKIIYISLAYMCVLCISSYNYIRLSSVFCKSPIINCSPSCWYVLSELRTIFICLRIVLSVVCKLFFSSSSSI